MRRRNASWIYETRKKAKRNDKCQFWMTLVYTLKDFKNAKNEIHKIY